MACGLYGKPLSFFPTLTPPAEIFNVFPNGPMVTMKLKVKEIGPINKQQTQYGARQHCIFTLTGQDEAITIRADAWQDHIQTCLNALPIGTVFTISFCPKPLPQQLIAPMIPWGIRLNTECQIGDIVQGAPPPSAFNQPGYGNGFYRPPTPANDGHVPNHGSAFATVGQYPPRNQFSSNGGQPGSNQVTGNDGSSESQTGSDSIE